MATLAQPPLATLTHEEEIDAIVDELFDLNEKQLAQMSPQDRAVAIEKIDAIAARVPGHA